MKFTKINKILNLRRKNRKSLTEQSIIAASGLFDSKWYVEKYPDVESFSGTPLQHYVEYGAAELRAAGPNFDTQAYLSANPDVADAGYNPLVHYARHGLQEGRSFAKTINFEPANTGLRNHSLKPPTFSLILVGGRRFDPGPTMNSLIKQSNVSIELLYEASSDDRYDLSHRFAVSKFMQLQSIKLNGAEVFLKKAIEAAKNEYIILIEPGDLLASNSLSKIANFIVSNPCHVVYTDETFSINNSQKNPVVLKPSWSPELLTAYNYFGRLTAIQRAIAQAALCNQSLTSSLVNNTAIEWHLNLCVSELTQSIVRLPEVLCHRSLPQHREGRLEDHSTAEFASVLRDYWRRRDRDATIYQAGDGTFRSTWPLDIEPLVSIIIPNKNQANLLRVCTDGLFTKTSYKNIEVIVVDNGSTETDALVLYSQLKHEGVRIISFEEQFNYSRACNFGASVAKGEMLLFLNNDIEVVDPNWLGELVRQALEPGVGVVGAKLLYPDGEIQHAGVALGLFTLAAHVFHRTPCDRWGPFGTPDTQRNWMAVTGACQLVRRNLFDLVCGYDESFVIAYSDVIFCLDIASMGFRTVYQPAAILVHHEGASRGNSNPLMDQILFARRLRSLGISSDPYFHPKLDMASFEPKVRSENSRRSANHMRADVERLAGPPTEPVDLLDLGAIASAANVEWETVIWRFDPRNMQPSLEAGARILLQFLLRRPDLRRRFPSPIRDGAAGGFALWVKSEGLKLLGLGSNYIPCIDAVLISNIGSAARKLLIYDQALRQEQPLFLLSGGRAAMCARLFDLERLGHVTLEEVWWFLFKNAESSQNALCETWAITPSWQAAIPDGGTVFGITELAQWVADTYGVNDDGLFVQDYPIWISDASQVRLAYAARADWRTRFPRAMAEKDEARLLLKFLTSRASGLSFLPRGWVAERQSGTLAEEIVQPGVNVLAHFSYPSGLRISAESLVEGLRENAISVSLRDVPVSVTTDDPIGLDFQGFEIYDVTIIHVQPEPLFNGVYERAGLLANKQRTYRIGYWYWEFEEIPSSWNWASLQCDEIWTATQFIADGLRQRYRQPVHVFPPGIEIAPFKKMSRSDFSLADAEFVFVFVFHMTSVMERKNPLGLIKAFKQAFNDESRAKLIIKTSFGSQHPESMSILRTEAAGANIEIIDRVFTRDETLSLMAVCDAYVSLHRSEGLGLTMAEAMLLGRPVVATRFSGNLEFMDDNNSLLVDYRFVTLRGDIAPYKAGQRWAEPSTDHAAQLMRRLFEEPDFARELGVRAQTDLERRLNYRTTGKAISDRLTEVYNMD